jgi:hypothetical protein
MTASQLYNPTRLYLLPTVACTRMQIRKELAQEPVQCKGVQLQRWGERAQVKQRVQAQVQLQ